MQNPQIPYRADIAGAMPPDMLADAETTLGKTARALGMFEAYGEFARQDEAFEAMADSDQITVLVLEDLHDRAACVVEDANAVVDEGHTQGYIAMVRMRLNDAVPTLDELRAEASQAIAQGFNIEEDMPEFGQATSLNVEVPFALADPEEAYESDLEDLGM